MNRSPMTPAELEEIGRRLYGTRWRPAMAEALGRKEVTIRAWQGGIYSIPAGAAIEVRALLDAPPDTAAHALIRDIEAIFRLKISATRRIARARKRIEEWREGRGAKTQENDAENG